MKHIIIIFCLTIVALWAEDEVELVERELWSFTDINTTKTSSPTNLQYFKFFDLLPDEVAYKVFEDMDLQGLEGKNILIGYGIAMPTGNNCKMFPPSITGMTLPIEICLPWWRIERKYQKEFKTINDLNKFFKYMPKPKPPMLVEHCKKWIEGATYAGGIVTCTTYYDKTISLECYENPKQQKCYVDNCNLQLSTKCSYEGMSIGEKDDLEWAYTDEDGTTVYQQATKVGLTTKQYHCPAGKIIPHTSCEESTTALMFPFTCVEDNPLTPKDDGEYVYCNENSPTYGSDGSIVGFTGRCPDGKAMLCEVDVINQQSKICKEPVMQTKLEDRDESVQVVKTYKTVSVSVISGLPDIYAQDPNCLRANTVEEARAGIFTAKVKGSGYLDDDIFLFSHDGEGNYEKIYCNQQHNGSSPSMVLDGVRMYCIPNSGSYTFDKTISIDATNIVSVQQASEHASAVSSNMFGRNHYRSTSLTIEGILVAPSTQPSSFPSYPHNGSYLKTWDNALSTLSLMFPFSGAYELFFYNKSGGLVVSQIVDSNDFDEMGSFGYKQLRLGEKMTIVVNESTACKTDDWVDWGGGVYGGKASKSGATCANPSDTTTKANAITRVLVKDLLTGMVTHIPLIYPLPYPNRIFVSKLKIQEHRIYRCYNNFPIAAPNK